MVVAVHGGSFDPVHVGHLLAGAWVRWTGLADEVWAVPVASHPFGKRPVASFEERVALLEAVAAVVPWMQVSTIEGVLRAPNTTAARIASTPCTVAAGGVVGGSGTIVADIMTIRETGAGTADCPGGAQRTPAGGSRATDCGHRG